MGKLNEAHPCFERLWRWTHGAFDRQRRLLVAEVGGDVLEIGAGAGETLPFYTDVHSLTLAEPEPGMRARLEADVRHVPFETRVVAAAAEELPFGDAVFDAVVTSLVLCSVEDPHQAIAEMRRVLKPSGRLYFLEHVRSSHPLIGRLQDSLTPLKKPFTGGCHLNRRTLDWLSEHGFEVLECRRVMRWFPMFQGVARPKT